MKKNNSRVEGSITIHVEVRHGSSNDTQRGDAAAGNLVDRHRHRKLRRTAYSRRADASPGRDRGSAHPARNVSQPDAPLGTNMTLRPATDADIPQMHRIRMSVRENQLSDTTRVQPRHYEEMLRSGRGWVYEVND